MTRTYAPALALVCALLAGLAWAGEDKQPAPRQDKDQPAKRVEKKSMDLDSFIKKYDSNGNGCLEKTELPLALHARFANMDEDKDGKLSRDELKKHQDMLDNWQAMNQRRGEHFYFAAGLLQHFADSPDPGLEVIQTAYDVFKQLDADKDGKIDREEWEASRQRLCELRVDALLQRQGCKDGKLKKDACFGRTARNFDKWDANHDGVLDRDELISAFGGKVREVKEKKSEAPEKP